MTCRRLGLNRWPYQRCAQPQSEVKIETASREVSDSDGPKSGSVSPDPSLPRAHGIDERYRLTTPPSISAMPVVFEDNRSFFQAAPSNTHNFETIPQHNGGGMGMPVSVSTPVSSWAPNEGTAFVGSAASYFDNARPFSSADALQEETADFSVEDALDAASNAFDASDPFGTMNQFREASQRACETTSRFAPCQPVSIDGLLGVQHSGNAHCSSQHGVEANASRLGGGGMDFEMRGAFPGAGLGQVFWDGGGLQQSENGGRIENGGFAGGHAIMNSFGNGMGDTSMSDTSLMCQGGYMDSSEQQQQLLIQHRHSQQQLQLQLQMQQQQQPQHLQNHQQQQFQATQSNPFGQNTQLFHDNNFPAQSFS